MYKIIFPVSPNAVGCADFYPTKKFSYWLYGDIQQNTGPC